MERIYLDHTATTPLDPQVFEAMRPFFTDKFGNASSIHSFGRDAKAALDISRECIASAIGASAGEVFFVGSGTEADNFAIKGIAASMREHGKQHIITSKVEHHAILEPCNYLAQFGIQTTYLDVDEYGQVSPASLAGAITESTGLVSLMHVNNEVGTINPIGKLASVAHARGIVFHTDAVQSFGKLDFDVKENNVDIASFSAHKLYGPKGIGAMYLKRGTKITNLLHGGGQERGRRAGTENVALAVGFAKAVELAIERREEEQKRLQILKEYIIKLLRERFPFLLFNGHPVQSLPQIINVSFDSEQIEIDGESLLFNLDLAGIAVTSGSACTSGSMEASHVLLAMCRDPEAAKASLRFSMGRTTTKEQLLHVMEVMDEIVKRIGKRRSE